MNNETAKKYLFIPSVPTPNGPLHLGHIGGPYLSADIMARALRMRGHEAVIICGSDSYESYVTKTADKAGRSFQDIANDYHDKIASDLCAVDIAMCDFINPLAHKWKERYQDWHQHIFTQLQKEGAIREITEKIAWDDERQKYRTGADLQGSCPYCKQTISGYFCEECGAHFKPEDVIQDECNFAFTNVNNLFLMIPDHEINSENGINDDIKKKYSQFLAREHGLYRMTTHHDWGLRYKHQQTLFSYGFIYAYFLFLAEVAKPYLGTDHHPFSSASDVITISCFGADNAIPFMASTYGISAYCQEYKPFDYYLVNYFYYLEGSKFSTSRNHAIWVDELISKKNHDSDIVRLFLASINVRDGVGHFSCENYYQYYTEKLRFFSRLDEKLCHAPSEERDDKFLLLCESMLQRQDNFLSLTHYAPHKALSDIDHWMSLFIKYANNHNDYFWWLKTLCLLIYPFMPKRSKKLWHKLNYSGEPHLINLSQ